MYNMCDDRVDYLQYFQIYTEMLNQNKNVTRLLLVIIYKTSNNIMHSFYVNIQL